MNKDSFFCCGKYALVEKYNQNIWLNHWSEDLIHAAKTVFWGKIPLYVMDLSSFPNYHESLIDNTVCLNWKIKLTDPDSELVYVHFRHASVSATQVRRDQDQLIEETSSIFMEPERQIDLQYQMFLYISLLTALNNPAFVSVDYKENIDNFYFQFNEIFRKNLYSENIINELKHLANNNLNNHFTDCAIIVNTIGGHYE